ncbi:MAG: putative monovalent cation/H+ antiporter subunit [Rickettsiaceae bacterium]|jgi:multicomponent Na+:H+ antiporter subunit F|nr:putative monovalent cation/H+ antiporter subunit [Rickettsiaceae bacterium]
MLTKYLIVIVILAILILTILTIVRESLFDKLLCINSATNLVIVLICLLGSYKYNQSYIDIAIIYGLLSYITNMAFLRFFINNQNHKITDENP